MSYLYYNRVLKSTQYIKQNFDKKISLFQGFEGIFLFIKCQTPDFGIGVGPYLLGNLVPVYGFSMVYIAAGMISVLGMLLYYLLLARKGRFTPAQMERDRHLKLAEAKRA